MRVLFTAHGAYGHVLPMAGLAQALARDGHEVLIATSPALEPVVSALGLQIAPAGMDDHALVAEARWRWPVRERPASWAPRMFTEIAAPAMAADLAPLIASWRPDLLVREEGEHGAPVAAAEAGVPWLTHAWGSPLAPSPAGDQYGAELLDPCPPSLYGTAGPPFRGRPVRAYELPAASRPGGRPLAYVGFGTVPLYRPAPELLAMVVDALLRRGFDAVVTTGDRDLAERLAPLRSGRVRVEAWVPVAEVGACELVVSHGGAGTTLAALGAGVPLLIIPRGAPSQDRMARACAARGVAIVVTEPVAAQELDDAVAALARDRRFRTAAAEVSAELAALPGPAETARFIAQELATTSEWTRRSGSGAASRRSRPPRSARRRRR